MANKLFGTDGIRGVAGVHPLDPPTVYATGLALARRVGGSGGRILIGMDTRESGREIAETLAAGVIAGGLEPRFAGVLPTAGVSFLTTADSFLAGVMISASHNPFEDNGIKVFAATGFKLPDDVEREVEQEIFTLLEGAPKAERVELPVDSSLERRYLERLLASGASRESLKPFKIVVDCANGAACQLAPALFEQLGVEAHVMGNQPDGRNINLECGSLHMEKLQEQVPATGAALGVAFDGDADRALFVADDGARVDGDVILLLGGQYLQKNNRLTANRVVTTVMANLGLEKALERSEISMTRTKVGDKYVLEEMLASGASLGGEQSGHIIFREYANTGDGLLTARMMLEILSASDQPLSALRKQLTVFPQKLVNIRVSRKPPIDAEPALAEAVAAAEQQLGARGRIVVRYSGTEPLARVMVEAENQADVDEHCERLAAVFQREIGV